MTATETASTVLAYFGAVFWSIQLLPQIYLNYSRHHTTGLHQAMMLLWAFAGLPLALHNILSAQPIALQVQAEILTALSLITWAQVRYYSHGWSVRKCVCCLLALAFVFAAVQLAVILGIRKGAPSGQAPEGFMRAMAVLSAVSLSAGVLRHYWDIWTEDTVRGISWGFVFLDAMGDLTSLLSIVLLSPLDIYATAIYGSELFLWTLMAIIGVAYTVRDRGRGKARADDEEPHLEAGVTTAAAAPEEEREEMPDTAGQACQGSASAVHPGGAKGNVFSRVIRRSRGEPHVAVSTFALQARRHRGDGDDAS